MESFIKVFSSQYGENISYYNPMNSIFEKDAGCIHGGKLNGVTGIPCRCRAKETVGSSSCWKVSHKAAEVHPDLIEVIS